MITTKDTAELARELDELTSHRYPGVWPTTRINSLRTELAFRKTQAETEAYAEAQRRRLVSIPTGLAARVRAGVALLDERVPGWSARIDVKLLNLHSCRRCVLGQLFGDYVYGVEDLFGLDGDEGEERGFAASELDDDQGATVREYVALTRLWAFVVRARQAVAR